MINVVVFSHLNDSQTFLWRERLVVIETQTKSRSPSCQKQCSMTQTFHHLLSDNLVLVISEKSMAVLWEHERLFVRSASAIDCFQYQLIKIDDLVSFFFFSVCNCRKFQFKMSNSYNIQMHERWDNNFRNSNSSWFFFKSIYWLKILLSWGGRFFSTALQSLTLCLLSSPTPLCHSIPSIGVPRQQHATRHVKSNTSPSPDLFPPAACRLLLLS